MKFQSFAEFRGAVITQTTRCRPGVATAESAELDDRWTYRAHATMERDQPGQGRTEAEQHTGCRKLITNRDEQRSGVDQQQLVGAAQNRDIGAPQRRTFPPSLGDATLFLVGCGDDDPEGK